MQIDPVSKKFIQDVLDKANTPADIEAAYQETLKQYSFIPEEVLLPKVKIILTSLGSAVFK